MNESRGIQRKPAPRNMGERPNPDRFINEAGAAGSPPAGSIDDLVSTLSPSTPPENVRLKTFNLRLPPDLHAKLEGVSRATGRSMHEVAMTILAPGIERAYDRFV